MFELDVIEPIDAVLSTAPAALVPLVPETVVVLLPDALVKFDDEGDELLYELELVVSAVLFVALVLLDVVIDVVFVVFGVVPLAALDDDVYVP